MNLDQKDSSFHLRSFSFVNFGFAVVTLLTICAGLRLEAATYDLNADWSDGANPNGTWSYKEGNHLLPHVAGWLSGDFVSDQPAWARATTGNTIIPAWFKSSGTLGGTHNYDWLNGDILIHTADDVNGVGSGVGNVTWTCPLTGFVSISGGVWMGRDIGRANRWTLSKNGSPLTSGDISSGDAYSRANPFNFASGDGGASVLTNIVVAPGDIIRLQLERTSQYGDYVGVNLRVETTFAPLLSIVHASTNTAVVSWPSPSTGFGLQQNTNSVSSGNWSDVTAITDNGTNKFIIVNPPTGNRFYRLFKP